MKTLPNITPDIIKAYQDSLVGVASPATAKRKTASLNQFFGWAEGSGKIPQNPLAKTLSPNPNAVVTGKKTWITIGVTAALIILIFLLTFKLKFPIPFTLNFAQEASIQTQNQFSKENASGQALTPNSNDTISANPAVIGAWNLYTKLKLTDTFGNPITGTQSIGFKIFDTEKNGVVLYTSPTQNISTDTNGSALISLADVPSDLFFQNNTLFLEPQVGSNSATARIPVSTASTPAVDLGGNIVLTNESPSIKAKSGNLLIEGQTVTVKATDGSGGGLEFNPDANGIAHFLFEGNKGNFLNAQSPNLTSGSLYYGIVANNATGYDLLRLQSGSKPVTRLSVDALGNTFIGGSANIASSLSTKGITNSSNYSQTSGNFTITQSPGDFASIAKKGSALSDVLNLTLDERGYRNSSYSTLTLNRFNGAPEAAALHVDEGNAIFDGQVELGRFNGTPDAIGQASVIYNTTDNLIYYYDGSAWQSLGTAVTTPFALISSGTNTTAAMIVGSGASLSTSGTGTITATDLVCSGCVSATDVADDTLDFAQFKDAMALDAATDIATAGFSLSTSGIGALNFASTGQVTFAGNVDAGNGVDITGNLNLSASTDLVFGGTTSLGETTGALDSGAFEVGVFDEFDNSNSTNVQAVLNDLDATITSNSSWTLAGDTGSSQLISGGNTASIVGGTNGIDTVASATDILTLNLDTTEIGTTTFGSGSGIVWTFDASAGTDPTITFGSDAITATAATLTSSGNLVIQGTTGITFNTGAGGDITFANGETIDNDTNGTVNIGTSIFKLTGGTSIVSDQTTVDLLNTTTTTLNLGGAATTVELGATTGTTSVNNGLTVDGDTTLGNAITDNITFTGRVAQDVDLIPITATGTNDLGTALLPWDNIYGVSFNQNGNLVCDASGANCPAGAGYWGQSLGALYPTNNTVDVLFGGDATTSAKFAFTGVAGGTPTASIAGTTANVATYLTGEGNLAVTNMANLTLGGATTGNVVINSRGLTALTANGANLVAAGDLSVDGGDITTTSSTFNLLAGATALNIGPTGSGASSVLVSGGSADTGCTFDGSNGNLTCSGMVSGSASSRKWNGLTDPDGDLTLAMAANTTTFGWTSTGDLNAWTMNFNNNSTSATTQDAVVINNAATGSFTDTATENLLLVQQLDTTTAGTTGVTNAIKVDSAANSGITNGITVTNSAGNITTGINIVDTSGGTITTGLALSGTFTTGIDAGNSIITNIGNAGTDFDTSGGLTLADDIAVNGGDVTTTASTFNLANTAATLNLGSTAVTRTINLGTGTSADTINIGTGGTTAETITIGTTTASNSLALNDDNWNITGAGLANFVSIGAATAGTGAFSTLTSSGNSTIGTGASSINTIGSVTTPGTLTLHGATTLDNTFTVSGSNLTSLGGNLTVTGTAWTATPTISGLITATSGITSNGDFTANGTNNTLGNAITDNIDFLARVKEDSDLIPITATGTNDLGTALLPWDNIYGVAISGTTITQAGNAVCDISGNCAAVGNYWGQANGALYPVNSSVDLLLGSSATSSAKFAFTGVAGGTPTASISGTTANVATYLTGEGNLAVTNMADLTLGGASTSRVVAASPFSAGSITDTGLTASKGVFTDANKTLTSTGVLGTSQGGTGLSSYVAGDLIYASSTNVLSNLADVATGNALISGGIGTAPSWGKIVLGTHTTGNYVSSLAGTANQITASAATGDITLSIPSDFRAPGTVNAVNGIYTGATAGTQRIDSSGNLTSIGTTQINGTTYTWPASATAGYVLQSGSTGATSTLSWVDPLAAVASSIYWTSADGALFPKNSSMDLLIGSDATTSAKFAFTGVNSGTPNININNVSVLNATTLGSGVVNSSLTSVGALASGSIASGFGTIATANTITGTTVNGTTGVNTGASAGTQRIDSSGNLVNIGTTQFNTQTYTWPASQAVNGFLQTNGTGALSWTTSLPSTTTIGFDKITSGTNIVAAMIVGAGASLNYTSTGTINASSLIGATWAAPGTIGSGTPNTGAFSTLSASTSVSSPIFQGISAATTFGNASYGTTIAGSGLTVSPTAWTATPTISGLITATSGLTANGDLTANSAFTLGDNGDLGSINTSDWDISTTGGLTGISGITTDGGYTQSGTSANTFTGTSTFSNATYSALFTGGSVGIGTPTPNATSILDLTSTTKGFLAPRMTTTERDAISTPATGLMIYNTTTNQYNVFNGTTWGAVGGGGGAWSDLTVPTANLSLAMAAYTSTFTYNATTGTANLFNLTDTLNNTGTGYLLNLTTAAGSTLKPFHVSAAGTEALTVLANGNVGIGTTGPDAKLDSLSTTEQLRLTYTDGGVYSSFTTDSNGYIAIDPTGGRISLDGSLQIGGTTPLAYSRFGTGTTSHSGNLTASNDVLISSDLELDGNLYLDGGTIANSAGTASIILSSDPVTTAATLTGQNWLIENTANVGQAALIINQQKAGDLFTASASGTPKFTIANTGAITSAIGNWTSQVADSATAVGFTFNTSNTLSTQGSKLLSFQNLGSEKMYLDKDGNLYVSGTVLSGNGTSMLLTNKSGGIVASKAIVVLDTSNNTSFTTTTTPYSKAGFGVVVGVGLGVTNDADGDGVCDANDICMVAYAGSVNVTVKNATTAVKGDYLFTSDTAGSAVASAKQYDGLIGIVDDTTNSASGYLRMIFKVQPQVTAAAAIDKGTKHNEYWLYADQYQAVGEGANTDTNLLQRGLAFDTFTDSTKTDSANTTASLDTNTQRTGLIGGQTLATSTTDNAGNTYLGSNTVNDQYLYDRTRDSSPQVQVELGIDPNWYNGVTLSVATTSAQFSQNSVITKPNPNLSTSYNGSLVKATGTDSTPRTIYITIKSPTTFDWTNYQGDSATGVTITPGTAQALGTTGVSATFTNARYNTGDVFKIASWFIEAESATRGAKQQFPEKSTIIATASSVDIIDADTQKLWMRFSECADATQCYFGYYSSGYASSTNALNGKIYVSNTSATASEGNGLKTFNFVGDTGESYLDTGHWQFQNTISQRNSSTSMITLTNSIVSRMVNDVSAAVIPNQPTREVTVSGWGYIVGNGTYGVNETVNLPYKFNNTPIVSVTTSGNTGSSIAPTKLSDCTSSSYSSTGIANSITTSTFIAQIYDPYPTNIAASTYVCYTWTATGQVSPRQYVGAATDAGVTVINETDSTAYSYSDVTNDHYNAVSLTSAGRMYALNETQAQLEKWRDIASNTASETNGTYDKMWDQTSTPALTATTPTIQVSASDLYVTEKTSTINSNNDTIYVGTNLGTSVIQDNENWPTAGDGSEEASGSVKYYTKDYISEEMVGDIRGMWPFAGTGTPAGNTTLASPDSDASVKANNMTTKTNGLTRAAGVRGKGLTFGGNAVLCTGTSGTCSANSNFSPSSSNFYAGGWFKTSSSSRQFLFSNYVGNNSWALELGVANATTIRLYLRRDGTNENDLTSPAVNPNDGNWHFIVAGRNGSQVQIYFDGQLIASQTDNAVPLTASNLFTIGALCNDGTCATPSQYFNGTIDEPFVTATALSAGQIKHMYEVGYRALQSHATTLGGGAADTNQQLGGTTNTIGAAQPDLNNQFMYVGTNSTTLGAVSKIDLNSDTNIKTYNSSANVPTGGPLLIDEDTKSLAVGYNLEAVGSATTGVKTMGVDNNATATSGNFIGKTITTAESFTQAYLWAQYTLDASDASNTIQVWASNDGGSNYSQCNLTNTDTSRSPSEYEYFCQFNTAGSSLKTKFVMARGSTKTNTYVTKYGISWIDSNAIAGSALGSGLYTTSGTSVANGSYIDVAHNQNSNDLVTNGWVYNTATSKWEQIDNTDDATGGTITYSGGYTIHTFTSSGTFTSPGAGNVEVLVVAGGGQGGSYYAGGGGGGGVTYNASFPVTSGNKTVTVGNGGSTGGTGQVGQDGSNSVFDSITSTGGGGGGGTSTSGTAGRTGGSGGGGNFNGTGGSKTGTEGSNGGNGGGTSGGGGGGQSAVGANGSGGTAGNGGDGYTSTISGSSVVYAGGGGGAGATAGGTGGTGGGGRGETGDGGTAAVIGTANTGGGGGGRSSLGAGMAGGSGIVIVRYLTNSLSAFKITQQDANTVRLYNYSGATQNLRLDVITGGLGRNAGTVSLAPAAADVDSQANVNSLWINKTGSGGNLLKLQTSGVDVLSLAGAGTMTLTGNFLPGTDNTYALGSTSNRWKDLFLGPTSLHVSSTTGTSGVGANYVDGTLGYSSNALTLATAVTGTVAGGGSINLTSGLALGNTTTSAFNLTTTADLGVADEVLQIGDSAATFMTVLGNGNVGIGTTAPTNAFHIVNATAPQLRLSSTETNATRKNAIIALTSYTTAEEPLGMIYADVNTGSVSELNFGGGTSLINAPTQIGFWTAAAVNTVTGTERMRIDSAGNVGIGTTAPDVVREKGVDISNASTGASLSIHKTGTSYATLRLATVGNATGWDVNYNFPNTNDLSFYYLGTSPGTRVTFAEGGNVGIGTTGPGYLLTVNSSTPGCNGCTAWTNYSDSRLKENIVNLSGDILDKIMDLKPVTFNYNDAYYSQTGYTRPDGTTPTFTGFVAQDLQEIFPEMVSTASSGYLDTNLSNLQIYLVKGIQQQQREIASLSGQLAGLLQIDGSCVTGDTMLPIRRRRRRKNSNDENDDWDYFLCRIDEILPGDEVLSLNESTGALEHARINKLKDMDIKEVYELTTKSGKVIRTTANHPYLTLSEDSPIISKEKINV